MKNIVLSLLFFICLPVLVNAQVAKKPRLVVIPSNKLLNKMDCLSEADDLGEKVMIPDYSKALLDDDLGACISKISEMFQDRGFTLTDLNSELERIKGKGAQVIPVDVRLELNYKVNSQGPRRSIYFELNGIDNYSSKQVASASGDGAPAIGSTTTTLLQEAVLAKIDKFQNDIQTYFEKMMVNGRESRLTLSGSITDDVAEKVEAWLDANCVKSSYSIDNQDEESMSISQAMMPLFSGEKALDAAGFYKGLVNELKAAGINARIDRKAANSNSRGGTLGDCNVVIE